MRAKLASRGIILLTTLCILSILAGLMLSVEQAIWHFKQQQKSMMLNNQCFENLESAALQLLKQDTPHLHCKSQMLDVNEARRRLKAGEGCMMSTHEVSYRYWVNELTLYKKQFVLAVQAEFSPKTCLILRYTAGQKVMSWRYLVD